MESLSKILCELYPHYKVVSEPLHLGDGSLFIVINAVNHDGEKIAGRLFKIVKYEVGNHYQEIAFRQEFVCLQIRTKDELIGILDNQQRVAITYDTRVKLFKIEENDKENEANS